MKIHPHDRLLEELLLALSADRELLTHLALFLAARDGFVAEGIPYDTALAALELATLDADPGRTADLKRLAQEMVPIFASRHIHREALAALAYLQQAIAAEHASAELVAQVADFLRRAQYDPAQPFEETA